MSTIPQVLRAIRTLYEQGSRASLRTLLLIVPAPPLAIAAAVRTLDAGGFLDRRTMRLTLRGFVASHLTAVMVRRKADTRNADMRNTDATPIVAYATMRMRRARRGAVGVCA
jgi:hypothetical protein